MKLNDSEAVMLLEIANTIYPFRGRWYISTIEGQDFLKTTDSTVSVHCFQFLVEYVIPVLFVSRIEKEVCYVNDISLKDLVYFDIESYIYREDFVSLVYDRLKHMILSGVKVFSEEIKSLEDISNIT